MGSAYISLSQLILGPAKDGVIAASDSESVEGEAPTHDKMDLEDIISSHQGIDADQVLEPMNEDQVIGQQRHHGKMSQGADLDGIYWETPANYGPGNKLPSKRGKKRASSQAEIPPCELKKGGRRSGNWTAEETDTLIRSKVQALKTHLGRSSKSRNQGLWKEIAQTVSGRTGDQCRLRWDTLVKSYKKIKEYCECHNVEFSQLDEEQFRNVKLATHFRNPVWYEMIDEIFAGVPTTPPEVGMPSLTAAANFVTVERGQNMELASSARAYFGSRS